LLRGTAEGQGQGGGATPVHLPGATEDAKYLSGKEGQKDTMAGRAAAAAGSKPLTYFSAWFCPFAHR